MALGPLIALGVSVALVDGSFVLRVLNGHIDSCFWRILFLSCGESGGGDFGFEVKCETGSWVAWSTWAEKLCCLRYWGGVGGVNDGGGVGIGLCMPVGCC